MRRSRAFDRRYETWEDHMAEQLADLVDVVTSWPSSASTTSPLVERLTEPVR